MLPLYLKAFHIIVVITWMSGIFYLPRLFVYHAMSQDSLSRARFVIMERKLYYGIMWPSLVLTLASGITLALQFGTAYLKAPWLQFKGGLVLLLVCYHLYCGHHYKRFRDDLPTWGHVTYRIFNELPVLLLVGIVYLVVVKPSSVIPAKPSVIPAKPSVIPAKAGISSTQARSPLSRG